MRKHFERQSLKTTLIAGTAAIAVCLAAGWSGHFMPGQPGAAWAQSGSHDEGHDDSHDSGHDSGSKGGDKQQGKGSSGAGKGGSKGGPSLLDELLADDSDSDRPPWAGSDPTVPKPGAAGGGKPGDAGTKKGDFYGDLYVILRDEDGSPVLNETGLVQPIDANGDPIPLDEEGHVIDETLLMEVDLGRLNIGRAPDKVLVARLSEVIDTINEATAISVDAAGRLVLTIDGVEKTIDSPLENLAMYVELLNTGKLPDITLPAGSTEFAFLTDGVVTAEDLGLAASLVAAAMDKTGNISIDEAVYLNSFLGINGLATATNEDGFTYVDYSSFTYDRNAAFDGATVTVLIQQPDESWVEQTVNILDVVNFIDLPDRDSSGSVDVFAQSVEDLRAVIEYIHEYGVPE